MDCVISNTLSSWSGCAVLYYYKDDNSQSMVASISMAYLLLFLPMDFFKSNTLSSWSGCAVCINYKDDNSQLMVASSGMEYYCYF